MEEIKEIIEEIRSLENTFNENKTYAEHKENDKRINELRSKAKKIVADVSGVDSEKFRYMYWEDFMLLVECVSGYHERKQKAA